MNEVSERFRQAVDFLIRSGYAKNREDIAVAIGANPSAISMAANGYRTPSLELTDMFCDKYPIDFRWLRKGEGTMIRGERELALLKRIAELERQLEELRE